MGQGIFVSGGAVRALQTGLDVISNNIANVNTIGFKSSNINFSEVFSTTYSGGSKPSGIIGGSNPLQLGNGVKVAEVQKDWSQGGTQFTGRTTDMLINGNGFFLVQGTDPITSQSQFFLTRAGNFTLDSSGNLVTFAGNLVRGTSQISGTSPLTQTTVKIPLDMKIAKDLDANGNILETHFGTVGAANADFTAIQNAGTITQSITQVKLTNFTVGNDGAIVATYSNGDRITVRTNISTINPANPSVTRRELIHLPAEGGVYSGVNLEATDSGSVSQPPGFEIFQAPAGGVDLQGMQLQLQSASVTNPAGLVYDGLNNYTVGSNSGSGSFGIPGTEGRGTISTGALEGSNTDLAGEFTRMIVTQRGLEANSRVIRTQSEVLQAVINIV